MVLKKCTIHKITAYSKFRILKLRFCGDFMRNKTNKHLGIEIDPELHGKLRYVAKYEDRSINGQVLYLVRQCIRDFEEKNGTISMNTEE